MKIAFDAKRFFHNTSGLGNYSRDLVRILASEFSQYQYYLLAEKISERGKDILTLPNVTFKEISKGFLARQRQMGTDAQNLKADIFHGLSGELPLIWNDKTIKKVVTIHDLIFLRYPQFYSFFDRKIHFWKFKKAVQQADVIIAISEQTKRDIIKYLNVSGKKIKVVYQGCHKAFKNQLSPNELTKIAVKYQLPKRFILNVGTIEERKNLLNVIKALDGTGIPLVVVGRKTKYQKEVDKTLAQTRVEVHFLENVSMEELAGIYQLADIFIYPSFFEGFGIPVIEALYSGTPVITSNISSMPEAGGPDSTYINPQNISDIKSKILFLWNNEAERKRRSEKGLDYVRRFNDENIAADLMKVYKEVLS
ncbi:glycosyltransferase family 4 protein [Riemerella anatipestifer]|uniref:glycosyltransferase family 4 protein n=1 Tax=Riemerella anatipestifer TaxID=34085 RepID=UPI0006995763|nr:glycosyltransferase family 1 protein [Riemerella anatipestifer]